MAEHEWRFHRYSVYRCFKAYVVRRNYDNLLPATDDGSNLNISELLFNLY